MKNMKVVLLKNVENLGETGDVVEVADGYARNFLIPQELAEAATPAAIKKAELLKTLRIKKAEEELKKFQELATKIDGLIVKIKKRAGKDGKLYGSVGVTDIAAVLKAQDFQIEEGMIDLKEPIKLLGEYPIVIHLPHNLEVQLTVVVEEDKAS